MLFHGIDATLSFAAIDMITLALDTLIFSATPAFAFSAITPALYAITFIFRCH